MTLQAMFIAPNADICDQLETGTAKRLISAGAKLYINGRSAVLSCRKPQGWQRLSLVSKPEAPCAA